MEINDASRHPPNLAASMASIAWKLLLYVRSKTK